VGLKKLSLDRNKLTALPLQRIKSWESLSQISLDGNLFSAIEKDNIQQELGYHFGSV
jgi:Leucine-rich repeat (LRR) protein